MRALELNSNKSHNGTCSIMTLDSNMSYNMYKEVLRFGWGTLQYRMITLKIHWKILKHAWTLN